MLASLTGVLGVVGTVTVAGYVYIGVRVGIAARRKGRSVLGAAWDALRWPDTVIAQALDKLS